MDTESGGDYKTRTRFELCVDGCMFTLTARG